MKLCIKCDQPAKNNHPLTKYCVDCAKQVQRKAVEKHIAKKLYLRDRYCVKCHKVKLTGTYRKKYCQKCAEQVKIQYGYNMANQWRERQEAFERLSDEEQLEAMMEYTKELLQQEVDEK